MRPPLTAAPPPSGPGWVTIVLTWRCPAACAHCGVDSSPRNKTRLDKELARKAVIAAARGEPKPGLSFTGGEPFTEAETLRELVALGRGLGMASEVITSAAWVADEDRCSALLCALKADGLTTLSVSYDRFHAEYIPVWKPRTAIRAGLAAGLKVVLKTIIDAREPRDDAELAATIGLTAAEVGRCVVKGQPLAAVGRAADFFDPAAGEEGRPVPGGCAFAGRNPTLAASGKLYPCCGPVMGKVGPAADLFVLADLSEASLDDVAHALQSGERDLFVALLHRIGPGAILDAVTSRDPGIRLRRSFTSQCDGCEEMMRNPAVRAGVKELLRLAGAPAHA